MDIFECVKNKKDIQDLSSQHNFKEKKYLSPIYGSVNLLEYAFISQNFIAFKMIIDYEINIKKEQPNYQISIIGDKLLIDLFQSKEYASHYLNKTTYSLEEQYTLIEKFAILLNTGLHYPDYGIKTDDMISPEEILHAFNILPFSYQSIKNLNNDVYDIFIAQNFKNSFPIFKELLIDYHHAYPYFIVYADEVSNPYENLSKSIDHLVLNMDSQKEFQDFLLYTFPKLLKDYEYEHLDYNNDNGFFTESSFYQHIQLFIKLEKKVKINENEFISSLDNILKNNLNQGKNNLNQGKNNLNQGKNNLTLLKNSEEINKQTLNQLLKEYHLKSLLVDKSLQVPLFTQKIRDSFHLIQDTYHLTCEEIGGDLLSLQFFNFSFVEMHAGLSPKGNLIVFGSDSFNPHLFNGIMIHEYSHYLQSHPYQKELLKHYSYEATQSLNDEKLWTVIYDKLALNKITLKDAIDYSIENFNEHLNFYIDINKNDISLFFHEHFLSMDYDIAFGNFILQYIKNHSLPTSEYLNKQITPSINKLKSNLMEIKQSYMQEDGLNKLWTNIDSNNDKYYLSNPFEIHSRLIEHRFSNKPNDFRFGTKELIEELRPDLDKFNNMLSSYYKNNVLQQNKLHSVQNIQKVRKLFLENQISVQSHLYKSS